MKPLCCPQQLHSFDDLKIYEHIATMWHFNQQKNLQLIEAIAKIMQIDIMSKGVKRTVLKLGRLTQTFCVKTEPKLALGFN